MKKLIAKIVYWAIVSVFISFVIIGVLLALIHDLGVRDTLYMWAVMFGSIGLFCLFYWADDNRR